MFHNYLNQNKPSQRFKTLDYPNNFEFCEKQEYYVRALFEYEVTDPARPTQKV